MPAHPAHASQGARTDDRRSSGGAARLGGCEWRRRRELDSGLSTFAAAPVLSIRTAEAVRTSISAGG